MNLPYLLSLAGLIFGFGFVIFWHELGHFLAAKWAGVKVEQFAVGIGQAVCSYRKGIGFRFGSTQREYGELIDGTTPGQTAATLGTLTDPAELADAEGKTAHPSPEGKLPPPPPGGPKRPNVSGVGETEYRLNWLPLGGYVKMLGQDDMDAGHQVADDPRAYNNRPIYQRMVIVCAGVVMNVLLAAALFWALFLYGFTSPPPVVGGVQPLSPAQRAGLNVGDRVTSLGGWSQYDFNKIAMTTALLAKGETASLVVTTPAGESKTLRITPRRPPNGGPFQELGITPAYDLAGPEVVPNAPPFEVDPATMPPDVGAIRPGDVVTAIEGRAVAVRDFDALDRALQASDGKPVALTVEGADGAERAVSAEPTFLPPFGEVPLNFAGMVPRPTVRAIQPESSAVGKLRPGDVILALRLPANNDVDDSLTFAELLARLNAAGQSDAEVAMDVLRGGEVVAVTGLTPNVRITEDRKGLGIVPGFDAGHAVVGGLVEGSPAERAGLPERAAVTSVAGEPVASWDDVRRVLLTQKPGDVEVGATLADGAERTFALPLTADALALQRDLRYASTLGFRTRVEPRKTANPLTAAWWGVQETRDAILQFYITLRRMAEGAVPLSATMGPLGIAHVGGAVASRGVDYLLWFLAIISANLAVVNFIPIPILDGGLFAFLIFEKLTGKPPGPRVLAVAQVCGLVLLASVFLFVTYNDLQRLFF